MRADGVIAMSPPLTMGVVGRLVAWSHRCPFVFNIQDVFPDAAVATGAVTNRGVIAAASWLERISYRSADAVTVLSADLASNVSDKLPADSAPQGAHDPQLRRSRADPSIGPDDPVPSGSWGSVTNPSCCTPATSATRSRSTCSWPPLANCPT